MRNQIFAPLGMNDTGAESVKEENPEHIGEPGEDAPFLTLFDHLVLRPLGVSGKNAAAPAGAVTFLTFDQRGLAIAVMSNISHADTAALAVKVGEAFTARH
jgi:hypothetical protein